MNNFYDILLQKNRSAALQLSNFMGNRPQFADLTAPFLKDFKNYLLENLSPNSARTYLAEIKAVINLYKDVETIPCRDLSILKTKAVKTTNCYLTIEELERLRALSNLKNMHQDIRDIFLLQSWTGCRLSDAVSLDLGNINGNFLAYTSIKTHTYTSVPIKPFIVDIIVRLPQIKVYSRATFNRVISNLCKKAGITNEIKLYKSGKYISGCKYEFVTSHTARRSFATNLYTAGIPINKISYLMGHSDTTMTERYICNNTEVDEDLLNFFK